MTWKYLIFLFSLIVVSCRNKINQNQNSDEVSDSTEFVNHESQIDFHDLIPESLPDSAKISIIKNFTDRIDRDSNVVIQEIVDSSEEILAFFRNDSLIKFIIGHQLMVSPNIQDSSVNKILYKESVACGGYSTTYYFLLNQLIFMKEECRSCWSTAMCNPEHTIYESYLYNDRIIGHEKQAEGTNVTFCGCDFFIEDYINQGSKFTAIDSLKTKIENYR